MKDLKRWRWENKREELKSKNISTTGKAAWAVVQAQKWAVPATFMYK